MASSRSGALTPEIERRLVQGAQFTGEFQRGESNVHKALDQLVRRLESLDFPYAIVGALALNAYGYLRATVDIEVLLTRPGLERLKAAWLGRGYLGAVPGGRGLRDTADGVDIDVLVTGDYPGDGREKPVSFPDPAESALRGRTFSRVSLEKLVELKLASGMTAPHRLKDLADVIELIRADSLPAEFGDALDPYVHDKYRELWRAAQGTDV